MANKKTFLSIFTFLLAMGSTLTAQETTDFPGERLILKNAGFVENYEIRQQMNKALSADSYVDVNTSQRVMPQSGFDKSVQFSVRKEDDAFYILFLNETGYTAPQTLSRALDDRQYTSTPYERLLSERFPLVARGNYIFKKSLIDGRPLQAKIYLENNEGSYIRLRPDGIARCVMDIYLRDTPVYRGVRVPMSFGAFSTSPLARVLSSTQSSVDWKLFFPKFDNTSRGALLSMVKAIREALPSLGDAEDGAQDVRERVVFISTGRPMDKKGFNCSGFVKWVTDGLYAVKTGTLMDITALKRTPQERAVNNPWVRAVDDRDPYFGLDWNRNVAVMVEEAKYPGKQVGLYDSDVDEIPFLAYTPDVGYPVTNLEATLYADVAKHPGSFYIASINQDFGAPPMRQHIHTAVFFPYFDENNDFKVVIFERNVETSPDSLRKRYPGSYLHFQRMDTSRDFVLPKPDFFN